MSRFEPDPAENALFRGPDLQWKVLVSTIERNDRGSRWWPQPHGQLRDDEGGVVLNAAGDRQPYEHGGQAWLGEPGGPLSMPAGRRSGVRNDCL